MLRSSSYYFDGQPNLVFKFDDITKSYFLTVRTNLKNYEGEIEAFCKWITPYLKNEYAHTDRPDFLGYKMYEEEVTPTLLFFDGASIIERTTAPSVEWETAY
jgi:hypothetical protein